MSNSYINEITSSKGKEPISKYMWGVIWFKLFYNVEKTLEDPSDYKEIKPVNPKGNQPWIFIGRTDAEAKAQILWPKYWSKELTQLRAGREEGNSGWDGWIAAPTSYEFEQTPGESEGQGGLVCCSPWGCKELDMT